MVDLLPNKNLCNSFIVIETKAIQIHYIILPHNVIDFQAKVFL
jgi:hypothetical protein